MINTPFQLNMPLKEGNMFYPSARLRTLIPAFIAFHKT